MSVHLDFETRSGVDLKKVGAYRYAEDKSTEVICLSHSGPGGRWRPGELLWNGVTTEDWVGHNQTFERVIWNAKMDRPLRTPAMQDCTMARALAVGLPADLETVGRVLKLPLQKDKAGHRLMLKMCKPKKVSADETIEWHDDPADLERLAAYCDRDVEAESALDARLPRLSDRERKVWLLDQTINDRGVFVDVPLVRAALDAVAKAGRKADRRLWELTNGAADKCSQTAKIATWVRSRGVPCDSIAKGEFEELIRRAEIFDEPTVEEALSLRRATTHMFRFEKILVQVCRDGRLRGLFRYHKAATGRWSGWSQSFPRVDSPEAVEAALDDLASGKTVSAPLEVLSECHRPMLCAPPGKKLVGGDFSNIEGCVAAWMADETWKLDALRANFAGEGPGIYEMTAAEVLGIDVSAVDRLHRQSHGKVPELACGYQGHVGAFQKMAYTQSPPVKVTDAEARAIVTGWRERNANIVQSWWELQDAAIAAVEAKGVVVSVLGDRVRYVSDGKFLYCRLPSGRNLHYASPSVRWRTRVLTVDGEEVEINSRGVSYFGVDFGDKWGPIDLYGGMQFNHVVQGFARDLLVEAMFAVEAANYPIVHHTHDDLLCEVDADFGSADEFAERMAGAVRKMAPGLPVAVKAWEGSRWLK